MKQKDKSQITLIISVYKDLEALILILASLNYQTCNLFDVIIAEDNNSNNINEFFKAHTYSFSIKLLQQEDQGFRKNKALNNAIKKAETPYFVFIDGDCILHKQFIKEHLKVVKEGFVSVGRRVNLGAKISSKIRNTGNVNSLNSFFNILASDAKRKGEGFYFPFDIEFKKKKRGLLGCNWAINKEALYTINGYDETFINPSIGEDSDIEWRLRATGLQFKSVKNKAIVFHLWHKENYNQEIVDANFIIMKGKINRNEVWAKNGLN